MRKLTILTALLFVSFAVYVGAESYSPSPKNAKKSDKNNYRDQRGSEKLPLYVKPAPPIDQDDIDYNAYEKHEKPSIERNTMRATVVLAVFTFLLWVATFILARDAKATSKRQLRAYLGVSDSEVGFTITHNHLQVIIRVENSGSTPAKNVRESIQSEIRNVDNNDVFPSAPPERGRSVIVPGAALTLSSEFQATDQELLDLRDRKKLIYTWGQVTYDDIFAEHQTLDFRFVALDQRYVRNEKGESELTGWNLCPDEDGNEST